MLGRLRLALRFERRGQHPDPTLDAGHPLRKPSQLLRDLHRARARSAGAGLQVLDPILDLRKTRLGRGNGMIEAQRAALFPVSPRPRGRGTLRCGGRIMRTGINRRAAGLPLPIVTAHLRDCGELVGLDGIPRPKTQSGAGVQRIDVVAAESTGIRLEQGKHHALRSDRRIRSEPQRNQPQGIVPADRPIALRGRNERRAEHGQAHKGKHRTANHNRVLNLKRSVTQS